MKTCQVYEIKVFTQLKVYALVFYFGNFLDNYWPNTYCFRWDSVTTQSAFQKATSSQGKCGWSSLHCLSDPLAHGNSDTISKNGLCWTST